MSQRSPSPWRLASTAVLALACLSTIAAQASLTFFDAAGNQLGAPVAIPEKECTGSKVIFPEGFASVKASDPQAALNLYDSPYCSYPLGSAIGQWTNAQKAGVTAVRWEGITTGASGTISDGKFPEGLVTQTYVPEGGAWVMDPKKGLVVVIIVAVILAIGILIGVYQVYQAAQYKPPPKKPKKPKTGLNTKKIKKKDAYYKKPTKDDEQSFQRLDSDSPEPFSGNRQSMVERSRESQYSEGTYLDWTSRNNSQLNVANAGARKGQDSVSVDMRGTPPPSGQTQNRVFSPSPIQGSHNSNNSTQRTYTPDLIHFDNSPQNSNHSTMNSSGNNNNASPYGGNNPNPYGGNNANPYGGNNNNANTYGASNNNVNPYGGSNNNANPYGGSNNNVNPYGGSSNVNPYGGYNTTPTSSSSNTPNYNQRGRGGEVLVPMSTFDNYSSGHGQGQGQGRSAVRRSSRSRSR
ncbi:hypothetical protein BG004_002307 [Podila humilis]|nr:hypothetical protein BG004_002307 [Podila humilis]